MPDATPIRYDLYVSYHETDADWVFEWLLPRLHEAGLTVAIDAESFAPGAPVLEETERVIGESRHILAVLTPAYVDGGWDNFETLLVQNEDPGARLRRLIPILLEECDPPSRIKLLHWVDFRDVQRRQEQVERVVAAVRGTSQLPELRYERIPDARQRWWELRGLLAIGVGILLLLGLVGGWIWWQRGPTKMDRVFNVAVAQIGELKENGSQQQSDLGDLLGKWMFSGLRSENAQYADNSSVLLWHDSLSWTEKGRTLGRIQGASPQERADQADKLAQDINAHALIYGYLSAATPQQLTIEFFVPRRLGSESNLTIGRYQFGDPILIPADFDPGDTLTAGALEERVTVRANALYWLLVGIRQSLLGRHAEALAIFEQANQLLPRWRERGEGKENLYLFLGRENLFLENFDEAETALQKALELRPGFARAQIGLAGVYFRRAQALSPADRLADPNLNEAFTAYEEGVRMAEQTRDPLLVDIATIAAAGALRLRAESEYALDQFQDAVDTHDQAIATLEEAIARLETTQQFRILGQAYQFTGLSYLERGQALERLSAAEQAQSSYQAAVIAFNGCLAQEANLREDEFYAAQVAASCQSLKRSSEDILSNFGD